MLEQRLERDFQYAYQEKRPPDQRLFRPTSNLNGAAQKGEDYKIVLTRALLQSDIRIRDQGLIEYFLYGLTTQNIGTLPNLLLQKSLKPLPSQRIVVVEIMLRLT